MTRRDSRSGLLAARRASGPGMAFIALAGALMLMMYLVTGPAMAQESPSPSVDPAASPAATDMMSPEATDAAASPELPDTAAAPDSDTGGGMGLVILLAMLGAGAVALLLVARPLARRADRY